LIIDVGSCFNPLVEKLIEFGGLRPLPFQLERLGEGRGRVFMVAKDAQYH